MSAIHKDRQKELGSTGCKFSRFEKVEVKRRRANQDYEMSRKKKDGSSKPERRQPLHSGSHSLDEGKGDGGKKKMALLVKPRSIPTRIIALTGGWGGGGGGGKTGWRGQGKKKRTSD